MNKNTKVTDSNFFELLSQSMDEAIEHSKEQLNLNSELLELPDDPPSFSKTRIKKIRKKLLNVSQPVFASILGCAPSSIKSWERGKNRPSGAAKRLLQIIEEDPGYFIKLIMKK